MTMFGELAENDNTTRAGSPWDSLVSISPTPSSSPSPSSSISPSPPPPSPPLLSYPKLVPESDSGNIEYKLQLIHPSPSRFARLVTQLKWRLLEGSGQAYYELGVADSGLLVGLTANELEQTLVTLEEMASEIGASVIVVKEIEVPKGMIGVVIQEPNKGEWAQRKHSKRRKKRDTLTASTNLLAVPPTPIPSLGDDSTTTDEFTFRIEDSEDRDLFCDPLFLNSSLSSEIDSDLSLFSMDPEPEYENHPGGGTTDYNADTLQINHQPSPASPFSVDLEISSVYKPRPMRRRLEGVGLKGKTRRDVGGKDKKKNNPFLLESSTVATLPSSRNDDDDCSPSPAPSPAPYVGPLTKQEAKALYRRAARDRRRELKKLSHQEGSVPGDGIESVGGRDDSDKNEEPFVERVLDLSEKEESSTGGGGGGGMLPEGNGISSVVVVGVSKKDAEDDEDDEDDDVFPSTVTALLPSSGSGDTHVNGNKDVVATDEEGEEEEDEKRLIVEALVVRKMTLEDGYLNFGLLS